MYQLTNFMDLTLSSNYNYTSDPPKFKHLPSIILRMQLNRKWRKNEYASF